MSDSAAATKSLLDLPTELLIKILCRLPIGSIGSVRLVNREFWRIISAAEFLPLYLKSATIVLSHEFDRREIPTFSLLQLEEEASRPSVASLIRTPFECGDIVTIIGSSKGYLCFRSRQRYRDPARSHISTLYIANPVLGEFLTLPLPPGGDEDDGSVEAFGFGTIEETSEFKILKLSCFFFYTEEPAGVIGEVFRFKENEWGWVQAPNPPFPRYRSYSHGDCAEMCPSSYKNRIHWLTVPVREDYIHAFDLMEELYFSVPPPPVPSSAQMEMSVVDGFLTICVVWDDGLHVWQMLDYGVQESWERAVILVLDIAHAVHVLPLPSFAVLRFEDTGILLCHQSYDRLKKVVEGQMSAFNISARTQSQNVTAISYLPSLESVTQLMSSSGNYKYVRMCHLRTFTQATLNTINGEGATIVDSGDSPFIPKEDFGGVHNFTNAKLVAQMGLGETSMGSELPDFGAVVDWDASRIMVFWKRFRVTASDSVAVIAANAVGAMPYFSGGVKGVARSMPTSSALDVVASHLNLPFFEVPTSSELWGNLMDAELCSIWGDKSWGMCSDRIHQSDGIWAVLAWLSILAYKNKDNLGGGRLVTFEDIVHHHWSVYGHRYYTRYDYENVDASGAKELMAHLVKLQSSLTEVNEIIQGICSDVSNVVHADKFEYEDPVDGSVSKHQGIRYMFEDGSRLVFHLSRTGFETATIHVYIEQNVEDFSEIDRDSEHLLLWWKLLLSSLRWKHSPADLPP